MFIRFSATVRISNKDFLSLHVNSYHFRSNFWIKSVHKSKCVLKLMGGVKLSVIQVMPCLSRRGEISGYIRDTSVSFDKSKELPPVNRKDARRTASLAW